MSGDVAVRLSQDEALILFDWLTRFNVSESEFDDQAEQRVLWNLEAQLETLVPVLAPDYRVLLEQARGRVRDTYE